MFYGHKLLAKVSMVKTQKEKKKKPQDMDI